MVAVECFFDSRKIVVGHNARKGKEDRLALSEFCDIGQRGLRESLAFVNYTEQAIVLSVIRPIFALHEAIDSIYPFHCHLFGG